MTVDRSAAASDRLEQTGLYVHVPFCRSKCCYCNFPSVAATRRQLAAFPAALLAELNSEVPRWQGHRFSTIFFGGGTPSMLEPEVLADLLQRCRAALPFSTKTPEVSIEVNPATIDEAGLSTLRRAGFNRLSVGVQSFNDTDLHRLGRLHSGAEAVDLIRAARRAGFDNLSMDMMYGLPGQDVDNWQRNLDTALDLAPEHLSLYELTVEPQTPLRSQLDAGGLTLPDERVLLDMMDRTRQSMTGYVHYEISNYCRPGRACRHNLNYWLGGEYLGLGPGAASFYQGQRTTAGADVTHYLGQVDVPGQAQGVTEQLGREASFRETMVLGLRMTRGVSATRLQRRFSFDPLHYYSALLPKLTSQGLLTVDPVSRRLFLTTKGLTVANTVMAEFV